MPTAADDGLPGDPRDRVPGPPRGTRHLCPLAGCRWYLDVPAPEVEYPRLDVPSDSYTIWITEVPMAAVEAALAAHLRSHDEGDLTAAMVAALRRVSGV